MFALFSESRFSSEDRRTRRENAETDRLAPTLQNQDDETNTDQEDSKADWTTEASRGWRGQAGSGSDDQRPAERFPEEEDLCSASVHEYLDRCFPADQPENPELPGCSKPQSAIPYLSAQTQYLTTWTLTRALILRGRRGIQSATSPEKSLPPQTPPKDAQTPPSGSSSTPELFSPVTPSPAASAELFSQPCPTPRVEEGGVVIKATSDGVLCSQEAESTTAQISPSKSPDFKKARISENLGTEASVTPSDSAAAVGLQGPTTLLIQCNRRGMRYSVLVAVVHPCYLKEVKVSGDDAITTISFLNFFTFWILFTFC